MPARLFCKTGELAGSHYDIAREATIGRLSDNEITLYPNVISGKHARIFYDDDEHSFFVEDLGSSNGTMLDGITVAEPTRLDGLNVITFANELDFIFLSSDHLADAVAPAATPAPREAQPAAQRSTHAPAAQPQATPRADSGEHTRLGEFGAMPSLNTLQEEDPGEKTKLGGFGAMPSLDETEDPHEKTRLDAHFGAMPSLRDDSSPTGSSPNAPPQTEDPTVDLGDETVLGDPFNIHQPPRTAPGPRSTQFSLRVTFEGGAQETFPLHAGENTVGRTDASDIIFPDNSISRTHAVLRVENGRVLLVDKGSKNGTYIDRKKVTSEVEIPPGTTIQFGHQTKATLQRAS